MKIAIHYNPNRGAADERALIFARRLFAVFDEAIDELALIPGGDDDLAVYLDGRLIHSTRLIGRLPSVADVRAAADGP